MARKARIIGNPSRTIAVDWDGTITERDILQPIAYEFGDPEIVGALDRGLNEGTVTLRDEIVGEYATVRAPLEEVLAWAFERTRSARVSASSSSSRGRRDGGWSWSRAASMS